jgi:hypothetical protein
MGIRSFIRMLFGADALGPLGQTIVLRYQAIESPPGALSKFRREPFPSN